MDFKERFKKQIEILRKLGLKGEVLVNADGVFVCTSDLFSKKLLRKTKMLTETKIGEYSFFSHLLEIEGRWWKNNKEYISVLAPQWATAICA